MIEIGLNKISKNYGFEQVLKDISFEIKLCFGFTAGRTVLFGKALRLLFFGTST